VQEQAYIVSYSGGTMARNFTLGQTMYDYDYFNRATTTDANGQPALSTPSANEVLQATLQHVVATYSPVDGRRIYVNGQLVTQADPTPAGLFTDWNDTFALVLGNEVSNDRTWQGVVRMVAIHNRALTQAQIQQNFDAGVGERFYLLFSVSHLVNVPQAYVMFEASQFDSYSYLFTKPSFISLDSGHDADQIRIKGLRIGVNGAEAKVGQAYSPLDRTVQAAGYDPATGFGLTGIGTVVALDKGPASDEFFLTFERIGTHNHPFVEPAPTPLPDPPDLVPGVGGRPQDLRGDLGLDVRHDDRADRTIRASSTPSTGCASSCRPRRTSRASCRRTRWVRRSLRSSTATSSWTTAACAPPTSRGSTSGERGDRPSTRRPSAPRHRSARFARSRHRAHDATVLAEVSGEIDALIGRLTTCGGACAADRTEVVVKAACSAVVGSASTLLQ
jgi:hypothetical protein